METKEVYLGSAWQNDYGINVSLNLEKLKQLPVDNWGNIKIYVGKRKSVDEKSKATHWVKESKPFEKKNVQAENHAVQDNSSDLPF